MCTSCSSVCDPADRREPVQPKFAADTALEEAVSTLGRTRVQYHLCKLETG